MNTLNALQGVFQSTALQAAVWCLVSTFLLCVLLVISKRWHGALTMDFTDGVQKFHTLHPRICHVSIALGLLVGPHIALHAQPVEQTSPAISVLSQSVLQISDDVAGIVRYPVDQTTDFSKYAMGIGALIALDKPLTRFYQDKIETPLSGFSLPQAPGRFKDVGTGGTDGWLVFGLAATYVGGLVFEDSRSQQAAIAATKSIAYSMVLTQGVLKTVFGRKRPLSSLSQHSTTAGGTYTDDPYRFGNSRTFTLKSDQYGSSFPSYHLTQWFAVAKTYQVAYDNYWVPYSLLTLGLVSDIRGHKHWVSDMTGGALLGTLIGDIVARNTFGPTDKFKLGMDPVNGQPVLTVVYKY